MEESITSAPAENAPLSLDDGAKAIQEKLFGKPKEANPDADREPELGPDYEPDNEDGDEPSATDDEELDTDEATEPVRYRLPDGTEATPEEIAEWKRGQLRQADYTRKTQEIAEQRKVFEQRQAEIAQKSQDFDQSVNFAIAVAEHYFPKAPDPSLLQSDPIGYLQEKEHYEAKRNELAQLYQAREQHQQAQNVERMKSFDEMKVKEGQALLNAIPRLKDKAELDTFQKEILEVLPHYGYQADDLKSVYDHRLVRMLDDLRAYRKLLARKPQAEQKAAAAAPVVPAGKRGSPADAKARAVKDARDRLRRTGSLEDGAEAIRLKLFGK